MKLYDLATGVRWLSSLEWALALRLAQTYGWEPAGSEAPREDANAGRFLYEDWDGSYIEPEGQRILPDDCGTLADALERGFLEAIYRRKLYLGEDGMEQWSSLIAFCRDAASKQGLQILADRGFLADEGADQA
ncbi:MAG: hypothetical protein JXB62_14930 [Pirellulales bacterium]|nr:hypothetical protein [Pirellulales bacterium]